MKKVSGVLILGELWQKLMPSPVGDDVINNDKFFVNWFQFDKYHKIIIRTTLSSSG